MPNWDLLAEAVGIRIRSVEPASGGCIHSAATLVGDDGQRVFVKANTEDKLDMFEAEADALSKIGATGAIRVPEPLRCGIVNGAAFLSLEHIELGGAKRGSWEKLGEALAKLHQHVSTDGCYGWHRDNVIGEIEQRNPHEESWATFFTRHRLEFQFGLADRNGYAFEKTPELLEQVHNILSAHSPPASMLHGDLWSGNASFDQNGEPVVFDPASYYGDAETDLAFSEMFGGFDRRFYQAYRAANPPPPGHGRRKIVYNLYHLINHTNHFGGSYANGVRSSIAQLLNDCSQQ